MTFVVDMFFSFRSPYSYLALTKTRKMVNSYNVVVRLRPVYPIAVRIPNFFKTASPNFAKYVYLDSTRVALHDGIPFRLPRPDPIVQDMTTLEVAVDQPYIHRLTRLCAAAQAEGRSLEFAEAIAPVLWDGSTDGWNEGDHLARAASRAGFDLKNLDAAITADSERYEAIIATNEKDHAASEHWGVPTFAFQGEPFFGQDRIDHLIWRLQGKGMTKRV
ncbi:2-hydroxychromene-2-carboxylate isomerase [Bradyrhizobium sp. AZCC 2289]|uniref:2-hydroxychromene-2-carboxylate isomerase n=1 Tax=Bradyrhizobium sp. AZCC 2289 TaxID=3117026 RepID=UPI002FEEEBD9